VNFAERDVEIAEKIGPEPRERILPPDQDVVVTGFGGEWKDFGGGGTQAPFRAVTVDRAPDLAGHGEADTGGIVVVAVKCLQHKPSLGALASAGGGKKFAAFAQTFDLAVHRAARIGAVSRT
jgi:hypothetical protein